ncbi:DUF1559 family PulG-like putative transporter [Stratiformator vulcanicus]|uniref:DUF1559 domain-containing protein n=1 Tax=Stratiformator vulcanicus TaxID=2527980 RepID=A0A517R2K5_9PLAN|nr:DUF1559 domain-containing protein [Stratiformator vulcanicus]QDT38091.1 hypothetical protein Pan189_24810 [Stratiformator vulcanicus]
MAKKPNIDSARPIEPSNFRNAKWAIRLGLIALLIPSLCFAVFQFCSYTNLMLARVDCGNTTRVLGLALHHYYDEFDSFPPAVTFGPDGRPWHSWRALILKSALELGYLEPRFANYRLDESWDSPHNLMLGLECPKLFRCAADRGPAGCASRFAIVGPNTIFPPDGAVSIADVTDGLSNTIVLIEHSDSGIGWTEPRDVDYDADAVSKSGWAGAGLRSRHETGRLIDGDGFVLLSDGSPRFVSGAGDSETVRRWLLRNDGERVGEL